MTRPTQPRMFATADLPLFSATAPRAHDSIFTPAEPEPQQLPLPDCTHPPARLYCGWAFDPAIGKDSLWIACCDCGTVLKG